MIKVNRTKPAIGTLALLFALSSLLVASAATFAVDGEKNEVVAKVAGKDITRGELEESLQFQLDALERQRAQLLEDGLPTLVDNELIAKAASEKGVDATAFMAAEIETRTEPVTDETIDNWYEENKTRLRGNQPKEAIEPQIRSFLMQSRGAQARELVLADLREKYPVEIYLEPMRVELTEDDATVKGPAEAPVTIVEFSDFQCPACRGFNPTLTEVMKQYGDQVKVVFRQFPLRSIHPEAQKAAEASLCAKDQGKFWELHDRMFADQRNLQISDLKAKAADLGVNQEEFDTCLDSGKYASIVQEDLERGTKIGINGTPSVYINGRVIAPGKVPSLDMMTSVIDDELKRHAQAEKAGK